MIWITSLWIPGLFEKEKSLNILLYKLQYAINYNIAILCMLQYGFSGETHL